MRFSAFYWRIRDLAINFSSSGTPTNEKTQETTWVFSLVKRILNQ
ncbi:hypothetical protein [Moraxella caviae]|nr:hypothetical protein [Moraxella caviae]